MENYIIFSGYSLSSIRSPAYCGFQEALKSTVRQTHILSHTRRVNIYRHK